VGVCDEIILMRKCKEKWNAICFIIASVTCFNVSEMETNFGYVNE
jgi:hypothetical protein